MRKRKQRVRNAAKEKATQSNAKQCEATRKQRELESTSKAMRKQLEAKLPSDTKKRNYSKSTAIPTLLPHPHTLFLLHLVNDELYAFLQPRPSLRRAIVDVPLPIADCV
jgi:hypothetical protein